MSRPRFTGSVYKRSGSGMYWVQYYRGGRRIRESSKGTSIKKAEKLLQKRIGEIGTGTFAGGPRAERTRVGELAESLLAQYRTGAIKGQKSLEWSERRWKLHLAPFFETTKASEVSTDLLLAYVAHRQSQKAQNSTINRDLSFLRRAFTIARKSSPPKVQAIPAFPHLEEAKARQGFLTDEQYEHLAESCSCAGLWLRAMLAVALTSRGEKANSCDCAWPRWMC